MNAIDIHITEQFMNGTYDSCKNVQFPSSGQLALDLMCGDWGASRCSPKRWFGFMGDAAGNQFVPFQINYNTTAVDGFTPMDPKVVPCSESVDVSRAFKLFKAQAKKSRFTGRQTGMLVCWLCLIVSQATPARARPTAISHMGPWWLRRGDVLHLSSWQRHVHDGNGLLLQQRSRWVELAQ